jgi:putative tryptophan/tyrosine transport system substrate-binding protein
VVTDPAWAQSKEAVGPLIVQLHALEAPDPAGLPVAFAEAKRQQVQAIAQFDVPSLTAASATAQTFGFALTNRLPVMFQTPNIVRQGGLISYGVDNMELCRRAAGYADRILKEAKAGDLPVGTPEKFLCSSTSRPPKPLS